MRKLLITLLPTLLLTLAVPLSADTTVTYQGQLLQDGQPFTGTPEMEFRLFDSATGTNQIGDDKFFETVPVVDGLFQVELDFGAGAFDGGERWLEIEVSGDSLEPRQKITGSPWSHQALSVAVGSVDSAQIAAGAVGAEELETDSLTITSGIGLQGGGEIALGGSTTISIADGGVGADQADSDQIQLRITGTCATGTVLVGINPDGSVACAALPIGVAYLADSDGNVGEHTSIAIRDNGLPIISYQGNNNLKAFDCTNPTCSSGSVRNLDDDGNVGEHTSIAIRDNGHPIISYRDVGNGNLKVFDCNNAECSSGDARTLDDDGTVGSWTSIAIRDNGHPIISYYDPVNINSNLRAFDCANAECSSGTVLTLETGGRVGAFTSIAIRDNGHPIISHYDWANGNLKAFDCANATCSSGTVRTLDSGGVGSFNSIAIRDDGNPIISYRDSTNGNLKVFSCGDPRCKQ